VPANSNTLSSRPPYFAVMMLSSAALAYEILLMRLFSIIQWHHFAYMMIGLALLGYGISGTVVAIFRSRLVQHFTALFISCVALFGISAIVCFVLAQQIPFNAEEIFWDWRQLYYLSGIFLLLTLPFFFAATGICLTFMQYGQQVSRVYAVDLLGAGIGSVGVVFLLIVFFPQNALIVVGSLGLVAALLASLELKVKWVWSMVIGMLLVTTLLVNHVSPLELHLSPYKSLQQIQRISGVSIIAQYSSPLGLLSVVQSRDIPLRYAPGLSLHAEHEPLPQLGVFTDGDNMTVLTHYPDDTKKLAYLDQTSSALPYHLKSIHDVLIVGVGGGADVLQARYHRVPQIDGIELNQQMIQLVKNEYAGYTGDLFHQPGVRIRHGEVRDYLSRSEKNFGLIQLSLLDAFNASASGLYALNESYLYTTEALQLYLKHIEPGGYLAMTRWIKLPPRDTLKLFATAVAALRQSGVTNPGQRIVLIRSWQTSTLLIKNGTFTQKELAAVRTFCRDRGFDLAYASDLKPEEVNQYNILAHPLFYQAALALVGDHGKQFMHQYKFNLRPATDDRPYFNQFFKWGSFVEIFRMRDRGGMPLLEWGYITLVATLSIAAVFSVVLILLPLGYKRRKQGAPGVTTGRLKVFYYFFAIGLAFLFIEIAFMQKFILFLYHPIYAIAAMLAAFLLFSGIGSFWSGKLLQTMPQYTVLYYAIAGIIILSLVYLLSLDTLFTLFIKLPVIFKMAVAAVLIAPLAFCMGMPFPLAMASLAQHAKQDIPWAWGINGCASVVSAVLATLLAIHFGFSAVILIAMVLYATCLLTFPRYAGENLAIS